VVAGERKNGSSVNILRATTLKWRLKGNPLRALHANNEVVLPHHWLVYMALVALITPGILFCDFCQRRGLRGSM
jgi:hypothetical protein